MEQSVSAAEANRKFSELLSGIRKGHSYVVTTHGKPIAKIIPITSFDTASQKARDILLTRLRSERIKTIGRWKRDELHEGA